jgi:hypothetical protein
MSGYNRFTLGLFNWLTSSITEIDRTRLLNLPTFVMNSRPGNVFAQNTPVPCVVLWNRGKVQKGLQRHNASRAHRRKSSQPAHPNPSPSVSLREPLLRVVPILMSSADFVSKRESDGHYYAFLSPARAAVTVAHSHRPR